LSAEDATRVPIPGVTSDYTLNVDTDKLGLWPGGFFDVSADSGFGTNIYHKAGNIVPINRAALFPAPDDRTLRR
jgi:porin